MAWYQDLTGEAGDPDDAAIETHRLVTELLADLTHHYSDLFGVNVDVNTALDLAHIERAAELGQIR